MLSTDPQEYLLRRFPLMGTSTVYMSGDAPYHLVHHDRPGVIATVTLRPEQAEAFREAVAAYGKAQRADLEQRIRRAAGRQFEVITINGLRQEVVHVDEVWELLNPEGI